MSSIEHIGNLITSNGYELLGHFTLPDDSWWTDYYMPLSVKLPAMREKYADDEDAQGIIDDTAREIEMREQFPDWYNYEFFVTRKLA